MSAKEKEMNNIIAYSYGDFRDTDADYIKFVEDIEKIIEENSIEISMKEFKEAEICFNDVINIVDILNRLIKGMTADFFDFIYQGDEYNEQIPDGWIPTYVSIDNLLKWTEENFNYQIIKLGNEWFIYYKNNWIDIAN